MPHRAISSDFHHIFHLKFDKEMMEVGLYQLFYCLARNLVVLSLAYHMYTNLGYELWQICAYFFVGQLFFVIGSPFVGPAIQRIGIKHSIASRALGLIIFWVCFPFILSEDFYRTVLFALPLFFIRGFFGSMSLISYDIFLSHHLNKKTKGESLALLQIAIMLSAVIAPILGGFVTEYFGFIWTTYIGLFFFVLAGGILLLTPDEKFVFPYSSKKLIHDIIEKTPSPLFFAEFGRVSFDGIMYLVWPLFLILVVKNMSEIGMIAGLSSGVAMVVAFWIGKRIDSGSKSPSKVLKNGAYRSMLLNFIRGVWWEPITIGIIDSLNKVNDQTMKVPYDMQFYKWMNTENTLERAHIRLVLDQSIYFFVFGFAALIFWLFPAAPNPVFIGIFVLGAFCLYLTKQISYVGMEVKTVKKKTKKVIKK